MTLLLFIVHVFIPLEIHTAVIYAMQTGKQYFVSIFLLQTIKTLD